MFLPVGPRGHVLLFISAPPTRRAPHSSFWWTTSALATIQEVLTDPEMTIEERFARLATCQ